MTILADTFLVWCGFNMVIPLISVHYVDKLGWAAGVIGFVLAIRQLLQQGTTPLSGMIADRLGPKGLICAGLLIRALGFALLAWATTLSLLLLATALAALGGSLFDSPKSAAIAALTDGTDRNRYYSLLGIVSGLGVTLGTQIGALLVSVDFGLIALISAGCFVADFFVTLFFLPPVRVAQENGNLTRGFRLALRDRTFVLFNVLLMGYWFIWVQFSISVPLVAKAITGTASSIGWVYAINSGMTILLGYPLIRLAGRWMRPLVVLVLGLAIMAIGFGTIGLAFSVAGLIFSVVFISAGTLLANPSQQTVTAALANPDALGSYFGVNSLALAIGGGLGNLCGGVLYDVGHRISTPSLPWVVFALVGVASAAGMALLAARLHSEAAPESGHPAAAAVAS